MCCSHKSNRPLGWRGGCAFEVEPSLTVGSCGTFEEEAWFATDRALANVVRIRFGEHLPVFNIEAGGRDLINGGDRIEGCGPLKCVGAQRGLVAAGNEDHVRLSAFVIFVSYPAVVYRG